MLISWLIQVVSRTHCFGGLCSWTLDPDTSDSNQTLRFPFILKKKKKKTFISEVFPHVPYFKEVELSSVCYVQCFFYPDLVGSKRKYLSKRIHGFITKHLEEIGREIKEGCLQPGRQGTRSEFLLFFASLGRYCFCSLPFGEREGRRPHPG